MHFVKFGDEYVAAAKITRVVFKTTKEAHPSAPDPFQHAPRQRDKDVLVALVTVEGQGSPLQVTGEAAVEALRRFCEREAVAIF
jgi:hypothetical protein